MIRAMMLSIFLLHFLTATAGEVFSRVYLEDGRVCKKCYVEHDTAGGISLIKDAKGTTLPVSKGTKIFLFKYRYGSYNPFTQAPPTYYVQQPQQIPLGTQASPSAPVRQTTNCYNWGWSVNCTTY